MIRPYYILLLATLFCFGSQSEANAQTVSISHDSVSMHSDSVMQTKSAIVRGERYTAFVVVYDSDKKNEFYIKNSTGLTIFKDDGFVGGVEFVDFDGDGYKDVLIERRGVDSGSQDLLLYDSKTKKFMLVGNCSNAKRVKHTKFYYSYEDCCMGRNWSSELFQIVNFKLVKDGFIKYTDGHGIRFYKIRNGKRLLKEKWNVRINGDTPVTSGRHIDFDLKDYWTKNYTKYINR